MKKIIFLISGIALFSGCIEKYNPEINSSDTNKYVIYGGVTNQEGYQSIIITKTASLEEPENIPAVGCIVEIADDSGNSFSLTEYEPGKYRVWIDKEFLNPGTSYQLNIVTPDDMVFISDFDKMPECPTLDSVYYVIEDPPISYNNPNFDETEGIQFYLDFTGNDEDSKFLRWELTETWEYHAYYILYKYIDMEGHHYVDPDSSRFVCWKTVPVKKIYTLSTENFNKNSYKKLPLHYVDNHTERLKYGYHLMIKQIAISEEAFWYWEQLRVNAENQGSLYETQPLPATGNIHNITNPEKEVLGFFEASSIEYKTLFIINERDLNLNLNFNSFCSIYAEARIPRYSPTPIYIARTEQGTQGPVIGLECWDCLSRGGINVKPDFWPN